MTDIKTDEVYQLGAWMGRKQAFASLAGRCSAADAECLRQIREHKRYRALKLNWEQFCKQRVGVSYMTVDRIIHRLEEFGPQYFILAQATGISEGDYRRISSAVKGQSLLHAGEEIPINTENAPRLAAAVEALKQRALPAAAENSSGEPDGDAATRALEKVDRALASVVDEIARLHNLSLHKDQRERLNKAVVAQLHRLPMFQFTELRRAG